MKEFNIEERLRICRKCPIYNPQDGGRCNSRLWLNPSTGEVSTYAKPGYVRGCGCYVSTKTKNPNNHCIAGKW